MVVHMRLSRKQLILLIAVLAVIAAVLVIGISGCTKKQSQGLSTNEERLAYLQSQGLSVEPEPVKQMQIRVPEQMNEVLERYNSVQKRQGLDLTGYLGQTADRYVYELTDYPDAEGKVYATLIVSDGTLIAADISSREDGFVRPLIQAER